MRLYCIITLVVFVNGLFFRSTESESKKLKLDMTSNIDDTIWDLTEYISEYCFSPTTSVTIFSDNSDDEERKFLTSLSTDEIPSYIFGKNSKEVLEKHQRFRQYYKLKPVHVSRKTYPATSVTIFLPQHMAFSELLENLKNSIWWNSRAKYLVVNLSRCGCEMVQTMLALMWNLSVLSAIYLCWNRENRVAIYTFNPYSHSAPEAWAPVALITDMGQEWSLFQYIFQRTDQLFPTYDSMVCGALYFDKLRNMHGYTLKLMIFENMEIFKANESGYEICRATECKVSISALKAINATFTLKFSTLISLIDSDGKPYNNINDIISGGSHLILDDFFLRDYWWLLTYPYRNDELKIVTPVQSTYTFNFLSIFRPAMWLLLTLLCIITILSLKYVLKNNPTMEFVRIFVNHATLKKPKRKFEWVCFICLVYMWLIINVHIQSNFKADKIAVKQNAIDSVEDLIKSGLAIYGLANIKDFVSNEQILDRYVDEESLKRCLEYPSSGKPVACVIPNSLLKIHLPANAPVHISKNNFLERGKTWLFSEDSPLLAKFNSILSRLIEAGTITFYSELDDLVFRRNFVVDVHQANLADFIIAMRILFVGWTLAVITFIFELLIGFILKLIKMSF